MSAAPTSFCSSTACRSGVIELKNPADEDATIWTAWQQTPDLQGRVDDAILHERGLDRLGRCGGSHRHPHSRAGVVQVLAHDLRRDAWPICKLTQLQVMLEGVCANPAGF